MRTDKKNALVILYENKFIIALFLFSLLIRVLYVFFYNVNKIAHGQDIMKIGDDQGSYWQFAQAFLTDTSWLTAHINHRPPAYPMFLALVSALFGPGRNFISILLVQCIISSISVIIIYSLAKKIFNKQTAVLASVWAAIYPLYLYYCGFILRETILIFLLLVFVLLLIKYLEENKRSLIIFLGVIYALLIHADPRFLFHLPFIVLYLYIGLRTFKKSVKEFAIFVLMVLLCSLPWAIRNFLTYKNTFVLIDTSTLGTWSKKAVTNVSTGIGEQRTKESTMRPDPLEKFEEIKKKAIVSYKVSREKNTADNDQYILSDEGISSEEELKAFESGIRPTFDIPHLYLYHFIEFWRFARFKPDYNPYPDLRFENSWSLRRNVVGILFTGILFPFLLAGIIFSLKQRNRYAIIVCSIMIIHTFLHIFVHARERYRMPIEGFIFMFAFYCILEIISKYRALKRTYS